ncbi:MAG: CPBP family intramembrane metalloprotease [Anaerolineales bacterium]|nr:CPBP family intramembrane metalloprotease [Anaerolineales bacterium]MCX7756271.1 CPBP family intramembrane metalloprotease [Anaerolineales bacterium]MDW8276648.1 type II CAAX endopeptidase family protein [Anaerolineales bacterium]
MQNLFLAQAQTGKNEWWRYLMGILLIVIVWQGGAFAFSVVMAISTGGEMPKQASPTMFALMLASFAFLLIGTWLVNRWMHGRSVKSLTTPFERVSWKRILLGALLWLVATTIASIVEALLYPGRYVANPNPVGVLPYLLIGLVLLPLQTSAEEYFFRGYLLQATGRLLQQPVLLAVLNGLLFALPHLANPEVDVMGFSLSVLFYALMGFIFAYVTLKTQTLEVALGMHAANNFFTGVFANYQTSALQTESFFLIQTLDPVYGLISLVVVVVLFIALLSTDWMKKWLELA